MLMSVKIKVRVKFEAGSFVHNVAEATCGFGAGYVESDRGHVYEQVQFVNHTRDWSPLR